LRYWAEIFKVGHPVYTHTHTHARTHARTHTERKRVFEKYETSL